jgi:hypothetical protein
MRQEPEMGRRWTWEEPLTERRARLSEKSEAKLIIVRQVSYYRQEG